MKNNDGALFTRGSAWSVGVVERKTHKEKNKFDSLNPSESYDITE